ncbi:MAG: transcription antitermination factor NusB [Deltaproteobacteria bacterium]|nr:transcription antitermination factor NusB [Deltaproteobacteria bacterium]
MGSQQSTRRRARILAVQALYSMEMGEATPTPVRMAQRLRAKGEVEADASEEVAYAEELVAAVQHRRAEIDRRIGTAGTRWRVDRMAALDVQVLRVAVAELLAGRSDVPPPVAIDEAVEIARDFGGDESPGFVNGILDAIARSLETSPRSVGLGRDEG